MRPLTGREVWRIGDWGGASGYLGRHWEEVGDAALVALVGRPSPNRPDFAPRAAVSFVYDSQREQAVQAAGLTHADALLLGPLAGRLALQPVDFKWSLEVARAGQVGAETLRALLEAELPEIATALAEAFEPVAWGLGQPVGRLPPYPELSLLEGFFLSPEHAANRAFLGSQANLRQETPLSPQQVSFVPVEGPAFFSGLPGWEVGVALATQEGSRRSLGTLEGAEHFYRLGAGVLGALTAAQRSIFDPTVPQIDAPAELARVRRFHRLTTTSQLITYLGRVMSSRGELVKALGGLGRQAYPFSAYRTSLKTAGIVLPERSQETPDDRRWSRLYSLIQRELSAHLAAEGRGLVAAGQNDAQALAALTGRQAEFARLAGRSAARLIEGERRSGGQPDPNIARGVES